MRPVSKRVIMNADIEWTENKLKTTTYVLDVQYTTCFVKITCAGI